MINWYVALPATFKYTGVVVGVGVGVGESANTGVMYQSTERPHETVREGVGAILEYDISKSKLDPPTVGVGEGIGSQSQSK